jgi:LacI family transcriptional regulator
MAGRDRVSIADVARYADVSPTTVSHVLSGRRPVAPATKDRVYRAVLELGYQPYGPARSLRTRRTHLIALAVPDIANPFYPSVMRGMADELAGSGYRIVVHNTDGERDQELAVLATLTDGSVDGAVLFIFRLGDGDLRPLGDGAIPVVALGVTPGPAEAIDVVTSDDRSGMKAATQLLLDLGRRPLAFIGGPPDTPVTSARLGGFRDAHRERSTEPAPGFIVTADFTTEGGTRAARQLLRLADPPRGIVCANDLMAIGVLEAAAEAGLRVPGDVAVAGFDDIDAASLVRPRLTTVSNQAREHGQVCARLLLSRLTGQYTGPGRTELIPTSLVVRDSAGPVPPRLAINGTAPAPSAGFP